VTRPPAGRRRAGEPEPRPEETDESVEIDETDEDVVDEDDAGGNGDDTESGRSAVADAFWTTVRVDPVEIALPGGVGYTLRAYRMDSEISAPDVSGRHEDELPDRSGPYDELDEDLIDEDDLDHDEDDEDEDDLDENDLDEDGDEDEDADEPDEDKAAAEPESQEVPVFLSQGGHLLLFRTPESLVAFVKSNTEHDLAQIDTWSELAGGIKASHVVAVPDDSYELDLVVNNLRGGHEVWDPDLLLSAGQIARDLGYALRMETVVHSLSPGGALDNLDEALRAAAEGGFGGFMARRKLKKIGAETASLGWRSIIGKISSVVDWRD